MRYACIFSVYSVSEPVCHPRLSVHNYSGIYFIKCFPYLVHCNIVMTAHKVKPEAVYVIFVYPVFQRVYHILSEHCLVRCSYVSAAASVKEPVLRIHSEIITRYCLFKAAVARRINVVVHNVHNHAYTSVMECLNHLLELVYSDLSLCGVG